MRSFVLFFIVLRLASFSSGWVFTDVDYNHLKSMQDKRFDENNILQQDDDDDGNPQLKFSLIYPGTKWCGPGNTADSYDDLGSEWVTDSCCREHDNCPDILSAGETKHNLTNNAFYTRLSCECDETFRKCLRNGNSSVSDQIGTIYFNTIGTRCFKEDYPITGCNRRGGWFNNKCLDYSLDKQGEKRTQWFDVPNY